MCTTLKESGWFRVPSFARLFILTIPACWLVLAGMALAARNEDFVLRFYTNRVGQTITIALSRITRPLPFSLAELLLGLAFGFVIFGGTKTLIEGLRGKRPWRHIVKRAARNVLILSHVLVVLFYALWGLNYAAPGLAERMHWEPPTTAHFSRDEELAYLAKLCEETVRLTNDAYREVHVNSDPDATPPAGLSIDSIDRGLEHAYQRVGGRLNLGEGFSTERGPAKAARGSMVMSYLGIAGIYSPLTGEAHYNAEVPRCSLPDVIAHEKAHQRGITDEGDANFLGFLACALSDDPYVRYSGYLSAQRDLLVALYPLDTERAKALIALRLPGVQRDVDGIRAFWSRFHGPVMTMGARVNDVYLKANRVEGGVVSYNRVIITLIAFARENDDSLDLSPKSR